MEAQPTAETAAPEEPLVPQALSAVLGSRPIDRRVRVFGGASGATLVRVDAGDLRLLVRHEGPVTPLLKRNPHRFTAMKLAADAGVAPRVHYMDETAGLTITDFIIQKPFADVPGGRVSLARALGELLRRLQGEAQFPPLIDYRELLGDMLAHLVSSGVFGGGVLDPYSAALAQLVRGLDWSKENLVASHNDPNPNNILFDGDRLWLIDWEAGYRNEPMVDLGIISDTFGTAPDQLEALFTGWLGRSPQRAERDRFEAVRRLTRLYYACFLLHEGADDNAAPINDLRPLRPDELRARLADGRLQQGSRETVFEVGKIHLDAFHTGVVPSGMREAGAAAFWGGFSQRNSIAYRAVSSCLLTSAS